MTELETALLIVLILVLVLLVWKWYRYSSNKCLSGCFDKCATTKAMLGSDMGSLPPMYRQPTGALNPNTSLVAGAGEMDGYSDFTDPSGTDEWDSYMDMQESFKPSRAKDFGARLHENTLKEHGLNHGVFKSHQIYLKGMKGRSSTASIHSLTDHDSHVNPWMGLRRPQMHLAKSEPGARVVSSEHHTQLHPGTDMRWSSSATDHEIQV